MMSTNLSHSAGQFKKYTSCFFEPLLWHCSYGGPWAFEMESLCSANAFDRLADCKYKNSTREWCGICGAICRGRTCFPSIMECWIKGEFPWHSSQQAYGPPHTPWFCVACFRLLKSIFFGGWIYVGWTYVWLLCWPFTILCRPPGFSSGWPATKYGTWCLGAFAWLGSAATLSRKCDLSEI